MVEEITMEITNRLLELKDEKIRDFESSLIPNIDKERIIGIKIPVLRDIAKEYIKTDESKEFLNDLPHFYHESNILHGLLINLNKDYDEVINLLDKFLRYADNWAITDTINPKCFLKHKNELIIKIKDWITSKDTYVIRFGIKILMSLFLDKDFKKEYLEYPLLADNSDYYVKMMIAWFYATALFKRYDDTISYLEDKRLSPWIHNKTISKARESYRISDDKKEYLNTLKIKKD